MKLRDEVFIAFGRPSGLDAVTLQSTEVFKWPMKGKRLRRVCETLVDEESNGQGEALSRDSKGREWGSKTDLPKKEQGTLRGRRL